MLRNFLYLDTYTLNDYLATLEGYVVNGSIDQTETETKGRKGEAGYSSIGVGISKENSTEHNQKLAVTDGAKFQKLYKLLEEGENENSFKNLDLFDIETWNQIRRGDLLEIESQIHLPESFTLLKTVGDINPLINIMSVVGEDPLGDQKSKAAFDGLSSLSKISEEKPIPIIFNAISTPGFGFTANLNRKFLRCEPAEIIGDATVFGKVLRIIRKGETQEVYSLFPALTSNFPSLKASQKREMKQKMAKQGLTNVIKGPAIVMSPLAVYR